VPGCEPDDRLREAIVAATGGQDQVIVVAQRGCKQWKQSVL
jgi:hypothetical protein